MDKRIIIYSYCFFCLCLILSCTETQKRELLKVDNCEIQTYNESAELLPTEKGPYPIPEEMVYGRVKDRDSGGNKDEDNLIRQYKAYVSALTMRDIESCKRYTFKDAVSYHKKEFPNLSEQEIWEQYFSNITEIGTLSDLAAREDWDIVACVPVFFDKVSSQNEIFITFGSTICIDAKKFAMTINKLEKCIAHSSNGGKNWEFITLNSDSEGILSLSCDNEIISILTKPSNVVIK